MGYPVLLQEPRYSWEFTQIGNCGLQFGPAEGWLVITHGVGAMRRYCIGASLFDLDDPSKEIGRLKEPHFLHEKMNGICTQCGYSAVRLFTTTA
jgi:predicted GH43/DUF377 family glycosyl hydrolase